ncbi:F0F1 ATP synthase subunit A [Eupransor demetentiae]|uniref:ATP synthase subunit a n=1 Tax=Eupransor demetentiae TaxID=3109584 RepID=A0ABM9N5A1_9LACO|nr:FoF1-type ATP synthase [Lactobacillaceae bacterium LMG 33000]
MNEPSATFQLFGLTFDWTTIISTLVSMAIVIIVAAVLAYKPSIRPNKRQNALEYALDFIKGVLGDSLPKDMARQFSLFGFALFLFLFVSNELGIILQVKFGDVTYLKSPTAQPLIPFSLAIMSLAVAHGIGVKALGFGGYLKNLLFKPYIAMFPINVVEQFTNFLTLAMRLFGNIFAGEIMLNLIADSMGWPGHFNGIMTIVAVPLLVLWQGFSLLIGAIQAYVFVMLTGVYISQLSGNE